MITELIKNASIKSQKFVLNASRITSTSPTNIDSIRNRFEYLINVTSIYNRFAESSGDFQNSVVRKRKLKPMNG